MYSDIIKLFQAAQKIIVFTGAGISTNCGIPDFRSPNGLYRTLKQRYNDLPYPEAIFDLGYFQENPAPFFDLSRDICSQNAEPSLAHKFIAWLESEGKIALVVTQNIDMLHHRSGLKKVLECHGTYRSAHCLSCRKYYTFEDIDDDMLAGEIPHCDCGGIIKPDIVFFGEALPQRFYELYAKPPDADLVLVMGSSLTVEPAAGFAVNLAQNIPSILVNLEPTHYDGLFTYAIHQDIDMFTQQVWSELQPDFLPQ